MKERPTVRERLKRHDSPILNLERRIWLAEDILEFAIEKGILDSGNLSGEVLDLGCGCGFTVLAMEELGAQKVLGVDNFDLFKISHQDPLYGRVRGLLKKGQLVRDDARKFLARQKDEQFSLVTAFDAVARLFEDNTMAEIGRVLAPKGQFLLTWRDIPSDTKRDEDQNHWYLSAIPEINWGRVTILNLDGFEPEPSSFKIEVQHLLVATKEENEDKGQ